MYLTIVNYITRGDAQKDGRRTNETKNPKKLKRKKNITCSWNVTSMYFSRNSVQCHNQAEGKNHKSSETYCRCL